ncbi:unnamed protein product [Lampetra planeri]
MASPDTTNDATNGGSSTPWTRWARTSGRRRRSLRGEEATPPFETGHDFPRGLAVAINPGRKSDSCDDDDGDLRRLNSCECREVFEWKLAASGRQGGPSGGEGTALSRQSSSSS